MSRACPTCKGTGTAPETIKLECVGCQCSVTVTYANTAELRAKAENVLCSTCRRREE